MPNWSRPILWFFLVLAGAGFLATLVLHLAALTGAAVLKDGPLFRLLFPGIFVISLPTILVMNVLARDAKQKDIWKASFRGCPTWMRYGAYGAFGYVWLLMMSMFLFRRSQPFNELVFSAFPMAFYGMAFAVLYSALHVSDLSRRCINGHHMSPTASFCEVCGQPAQLPPSLSL